MRTYEEIRGYRPDFLVKYRLYAESEGGRKLTYQHLRCDFMYEGDNPLVDGIYMIHPEFIDDSGRPFEYEIAVPLAGKAYMWILAPEMRASVHRSRVKVGVRGYFMEGSRKVGEVEIESVVGLNENPLPSSWNAFREKLNMNLIHSFQIDDWSPALNTEERDHAISTLENGGVLYLPKLPFKLKADELPLLDTRVSDGKAKNISLRPKRGSAGDEFKGAQGSVAELVALEQMLKRYRANATSLVSQLFPAYMPHLITANTSYRPFEIAGRHSSYRKDDTRLHADSFPSNPTLGQRLLRVFSNINPEGRTRAWRVGEPFEAMAEKFLPSTKPLFLGQSWLMHQLHITKKPRSEYDHLMLQLHDHVKADLQYQESCPQQAFDFPAGCTWIVYSDQVLHAAMSGQFLMEQTFHLPVEGLYNPDSSPLRILERMTGRSLID